MTRSQHKHQREPRTIAKQIDGCRYGPNPSGPPYAPLPTLVRQMQPEVVCDLCAEPAPEPTIRGRWRTCPACTRRLINIDAQAAKDMT